MIVKKIGEIASIFKKNKHFLITSHTNLDGDALGSELALYFMLIQLQKDVTIVNQDRIPSIYEFMPGIEKIACSEELEKNYFLNINPDTVLVVLDSSNPERIGDVHQIFNKVKLIVNIDHHPSNTKFGHYNYIDPCSSSVGEIIHLLGQELGCKLNEQIAVPLYTAIITDTGSFRFANTSAKTFYTASLLVEAGAKPHKIANSIYNRNELSGLKILGEALLKLRIDTYSKISWTVITRDIMKKYSAKDEETEGIVDKILSIKDIRVSVLFKEGKKGQNKISFRSKGKFNVDHFSRLFGGGGHPNAAGCQLEGDIKDIENKVITELKKRVVSFS